MRSIKFSHEWDKLKPENLKPGSIITTFRAYNPKKHLFYENNLGEDFEIVLNGKKLARAELILIRYLWSNQLDLNTIRQDTHNHYSYDDWINLIKKFYGNERVFGMLLKFRVKEIYNKEGSHDQAGN